MNYSVNISDENYQVPKRFHVHVPDLFNYLLKVVGVDYMDEKKEKQARKLDLGKRRSKGLRTLVLFHLFRKMKKEQNIKPPKHENSKSF